MEGKRIIKSQFNEYSVENEPFARGSFGKVFLATDKKKSIMRWENLNFSKKDFLLYLEFLRLALKEIEIDTKKVEIQDAFYLSKEATHLAHFSSPYIIQYYDSFFFENAFYIVTEYCEVFYYFIKNEISH